MDKKLLVFIFLGFISIFGSLFLKDVLATTYLDIYATGIVQPDQNITISGQMTNDTETDVISGINVSATVTSGGSGDDITGSDGSFEFNITAPSTTGEYLVTVTTNESTPKTKTIPIYLSNVTGGSITYIDKSPPFSTETTFTITVTLLDGTTPVSGYTPNVSIYTFNGPPVSWVIANQSATSDANGAINYTVTIPSTI